MLRGALNDADLAAHLRGAGVDPDSTALAIARALLGRGAPLTADAVLRVRAAVVASRADGADDLRAQSAEIDAAAYLEARGLPVSRASVDIARRALASRETLGNRVAEFRAALTDLGDELARLESGGYPIPLTRDRVDPAQPRGTARRDLPVPPQEEGSDPNSQAHAERGAQLPTALAARTGPPRSSATVPMPAAIDASVEDVPPGENSERSTEADPAGSPARGAGDARGTEPPPGARSGSMPTRLTPPTAEPPADDSAQSQVSDSESPAGARPERSVPQDREVVTQDRQTADGLQRAPARSISPAPEQAAEPDAVTPAPGRPAERATGHRAAGEETPIASAGGSRGPVVDEFAGVERVRAPAPDVPTVARRGDRVAGAPDDAAVEAFRAPQPYPDRSAPRPLSTLVREMLARLPSDEAFHGSDDSVASVLREVIAEHGTPIEAKLARLLIREAPTGQGRLEQDLRVVLARVIDEAMSASATARQTPGLQSLGDDLGRVADLGSQIQAQLEFGQLANAAPRADTGQPPYLAFQIPIGQRGTSESVEIRVRQDDSGAAGVDPENTHLIFNFDLADLGPLRVGLMVHRQRISCQISAGSPEIRDMLGDHAADLRAGLAGLGYTVDPVRCDLLGSPTGQVQSSMAGPPASPVSRLDARI